MFISLEDLNKLHELPGKGVIVTTGGGMGAFPVLMERGGASNTMLSIQVPYHPFETEAFLGRMPKKLVTRDTARSLCVRAFEQAVGILKTHGDDTPAFGIGATASLQRTPMEREGRRHEIYVCGQSENGTAIELSWEFNPLYDAREMDAPTRRLYEEELMASMIAEVLSLLKGYGTNEHQGLGLLREYRTVKANMIRVVDADIQALYRNPGFCFGFKIQNGQARLDTSLNALSPICCGRTPVMPGSFNPMHEGHTAILQVAEEMLGKVPALELCVSNADKVGVSLFEIWDRVFQIATVLPPDKTYNLYMTRATRFMDKAAMFPGSTFLVGMDTAMRIVDPKYADLSDVKSSFETNGIRFLVFGRNVNGAFEGSHSQLGFLSPLSVVVPERVFRSDISSSQVRKGAQ